MAERLNAHDSKSCYAGMYTRVQIPFSAPQKVWQAIGSQAFLFYPLYVVESIEKLQVL